MTWLLSLRNSNTAVDQESFLYYALMFATAARNSAIRALKFKHFRAERGQFGFDYREVKTMRKPAIFFPLFTTFWKLFKAHQKRAFTKWKRKKKINQIDSSDDGKQKISHEKGAKVMAPHSKLQMSDAEFQ